MSDVQKLKERRKSVKGSITRILTYCAQVDPPPTYTQVRAREETLEKLYAKYNEIQSDIDALVTSQDEAVEDTYRIEMENLYYNIKAIMLTIAEQNALQSQATPASQQDKGELTAAMQALMEHQRSMSALMEGFALNLRTENVSTPNTIQHRAEIQLPRIQLPDFDGNILNWIRFRDLFVALIHNRENLSSVEKLEYLQSKLRGEAAATVKHLSPAENNYQVAWELLKKKYDNAEKVKAAYMELIFEQPPMKCATLVEIKRIYSNASEGYHALKVVDETVGQWDTVLLFNMEKKLEASTATLWFREKRSLDNPTFETFLEFCEGRIYELESLQNSQLSQTKERPRQRPPVRSYSTTLQMCPICKKNHAIYQCQEFAKLSIPQRRASAQQNSLCFNCLQTSHQALNCKSSSCKKCNRRHHTLLHFTNEGQATYNTREQIRYNNNSTTANTTKAATEETDQKMIVNAHSIQSNTACVVLPTAIIHVLDENNSVQRCRALLDTGSQGTLIIEACAQRLNLKRSYDKTAVSGLGTNSQIAKGRVQLQIITNMQNNITTEVTALCLNKLTQTLPSVEVDNSQLRNFKHLNMADPLWNKPGKVDIILGADVLMHFITADKIENQSGDLTVLSTVFGWVVMGKALASYPSQIMVHHTCVDLNQQLQQFWEIEETADKVNRITPEEEEAERIYQQTTTRDRDGRYIVKLPVRNNKMDIGESKDIAMRRLNAMERRFKVQPEIKCEYHKFMREYLDLKHMEPIDETKHEKICYLPHHAVMKPSSTTTKLRVVFDASAKTSNGKSLNDNLLVGAKVQRDLFDIIISFRLHDIAFTGDAEKMYRQVLVHPDDRQLQCILWRNNEEETVKPYRLNTVTYGTASAAYLATRTLNQAAYDSASTHAVAATAIMQNFYVDDFIYSSDNVSDAIKLKGEICEILTRAGFRMRKWATNSTELLEGIATEDRATAHTEIGSSAIVSTLGLLWDTTQDCFRYSVAAYAKQIASTKRSVLSNIARVYDPMGWIAPIIIRLKIFMQKLWLMGVSWDEDLPANVINEWANIINSIDQVKTITIDRCLHVNEGFKIEIHGFSDSSEYAYAAAVYAKIYGKNNEIYTNLIAAKTRVAPVKQVSLPRLELCAAHLLVKLMKRICEGLPIENVTMYGWTDSTIVLAWLSSHPRRWKSFVANRTSDIIQALPAEQWRHIKSESNPADLATRGLSSAQLVNNKLWFHGPDELRENYRPASIQLASSEEVNTEERKSTVVYSSQITESDFITRYSNFTTLTRITALIYRFVHNCKKENKNSKLTGHITIEELNTAHDKLSILSQQQMFLK